MYKAVIFDLDGVICFTDEYHYLAWKSLASSLSIPFTKEDNLRQRGVSRMESLEVVLEKSGRVFTEEEKIELAEKKNTIYKSYLETMTEADCSDEVRKTIIKLREMGIRTAIGSSSRNTPIILEKLGIRDLFDAVSDGNNITHSKPHPEVFLMASCMLGILPQECLVVEDAPSGIDAAAAGGFCSAGIGPASTYHRTTYPIGGLGEIPGIVEKSRNSVF